MLRAATGALDLPVGNTPFPLNEDFIWEIGDARLDRRRPRTPVWFARRLWESSVQQRVSELVRVRPSIRPRVILTSSLTDRIGGFNVPGAISASLTDVLVRPNSLVVDPDILGGRLRIAPDPEVAGPIALSPDGKTLRINGGSPILFRSDAQIGAIRRLAEAYRRGAGVPIKELTDLGSPRRLFGTSKWNAISLLEVAGRALGL